MLDLRPFAKLGRFDNDWLNARYHFNFSQYREPGRDGWGALLVWNDDTIKAKSGFPPHGHRDMEIVTYIRKGAISHRDHLGNEGKTNAGDVQVMWAGKGIQHAEMNMEDEACTLFQIWIWPSESGVEPGWRTREFPHGERTGQLVALASGRARHKDALPIHQDAAIMAATLSPGQTVTHELDAGRYAYLVNATGKIEVNGVVANARDGLAIKDEPRLAIKALEDSSFLLADVPPSPR